MQAQIDMLYSCLTPFLDQTSFSSVMAMPAWPQVTDATSLARPKHPHCFGQASPAFAFKMANYSLKNMGITLGTKAGEQDISNLDSALPRDVLSTSVMERASDPLWQLQGEEALRLIALYDDEVNSVYPIIDIPRITGHVGQIYRNSTFSLGSDTRLSDANTLTETELDILKLVLAISLVIEGKGTTDLGACLVDSVQAACNQKTRDIRADKNVVLQLVLEVRAAPATSLALYTHAHAHVNQNPVYKKAPLRLM